jgi:hypothetical protein
MISRAIVQSAIVLMNRRMKAERGVITFVPVCSKVAGMRCIIPEDYAPCKENATARQGMAHHLVLRSHAGRSHVHKLWREITRENAEATADGPDSQGLGSTEPSPSEVERDGTTRFRRLSISGS